MINMKGSLIGFLLFFMLNLNSPYALGQTSHILVNELVSKAEKLDLHLDPVWLALLHTSGDEPHITDESFLLSSSNYSTKNELLKTILILFEEPNNNSSHCKFPARLKWLSNKLDIPYPQLSHCTELQEFLGKAPADDIALVYTSENLSQPSSMMGHIFLKISGTGTSRRATEHAISFFTEIQGINVPKIIFESLVTGKKGYYALSPYQQKLDYYLKDEQRNVWEYKLDISNFNRSLLHYHIWELKDTQLEYLFDDYNCATVINYMLATVNPALYDPDTQTYSPLDVVKRVNSTGMVSEVNVYPSDKWKIRMLTPYVSSNVIDAIKATASSEGLDAVVAATHSSQEQFVALEIAESHLRFTDKDRDQVDTNLLYEKLSEQQSALGTEYFIDISGFKSPIKTPPDSQSYGGLKSLNKSTYLLLGILPASHHLMDDNRQYFSENELRLGDLSVLIPTDNPGIKLDSLHLYSIKSIIPYDSLTGGVSGKFSVAIQKHYDSTLDHRLSGEISGGLGLGYAIQKDSVLYAMMGPGLGTRPGNTYLFSDIELGWIANLAWSSKLGLSINTIYNQLDNRKTYLNTKLSYAIRLSNQLSIHINGNKLQNDTLHDHEADLTFKYHY